MLGPVSTAAAAAAAAKVVNGWEGLEKELELAVGMAVLAPSCSSVQKGKIRGLLKYQERSSTPALLKWQGFRENQK